jgi:hypothetical protein
MASDHPQAEKEKILVKLITLGQMPVYLSLPPPSLQDPTNTASKLGNQIWNIKGWSGMARLFWQNSTLAKTSRNRNNSLPLV